MRSLVSSLQKSVKTQALPIHVGDNKKPQLNDFYRRKPADNDFSLVHRLETLYLLAQGYLAQVEIIRAALPARAAPLAQSYRAEVGILHRYHQLAPLRVAAAPLAQVLLAQVEVNRERTHCSRMSSQSGGGEHS